MKVTVIINTINEKPETLQRAVDSYLNQDHKDIQIILSTIEGDRSLSVDGVDFAILSKDKHVGRSPRGSYQQLNNAIPLIQGEWFCFASGNDYAEPNKISLELTKCLESNKEVCYSAYNHIYPTSHAYQPMHEYDFEKHLIGNFVSDCSLMSKRLVDKYLPFIEEFNNYAYWDLWLRIFKGEGDVFCYNDIATWNYVYQPTSMHIERKESQEKMKHAEFDRERMLSQYR